jgi:hypothetical protein
VAKREAFLLRIDPEILAALRRWADDDLRSLNAQIDFLLRRGLREAGRLPAAKLRRTDPVDGKCIQPIDSRGR